LRPRSGLPWNDFAAEEGAAAWIGASSQKERRGFTIIGRVLPLVSDPDGRFTAVCCPPRISGDGYHRRPSAPSTTNVLDRHAIDRGDRPRKHASASWGRKGAEMDTPQRTVVVTGSSAGDRRCR
jgi:hypothetical protein